MANSCVNKVINVDGAEENGRTSVCPNLKSEHTMEMIPNLEINNKFLKEKNTKTKKEMEQKARAAPRQKDAKPGKSKSLSKNDVGIRPGLKNVL